MLSATNYHKEEDHIPEEDNENNDNNYLEDSSFDSIEDIPLSTQKITSDFDKSFAAVLGMEEVVVENESEVLNEVLKEVRKKLKLPY
jgi:hypothetical protein